MTRALIDGLPDGEIAAPVPAAPAGRLGLGYVEGWRGPVLIALDAGRASGQAADLRSDHPWSPYDQLDVKMATHRNGDVAARVSVRFDETLESLRLIRALCDALPGGAASAPLAAPAKAGLGAGWVEGWRGEVFVALELDDAGAIRRCHCHDPSWQNWPVIEHAVIGNIVPDFPLINKSFNLSYSGHDL